MTRLTPWRWTGLWTSRHLRDFGAWPSGCSLPSSSPAPTGPASPSPGRSTPTRSSTSSAFGTWTALFTGASFFGPPLSWRNIRFAFLIAPIYAAIESSQALPFVHRTAAWDDYAANLTGITLACIGALILSRLVRPTPAHHAALHSTLPPQ